MSNYGLCFIGIVFFCTSFVFANKKKKTIPEDLVNIHKINPHILVELRYATKRNFTGKKIYSFTTCYVHKVVAQKLDKIQKELEKKNLGLKIWDGFRPLKAQEKLWKTFPDQRYVCPPGQNRGRHTRGTAIDVTLVDKWGNELKMPTAFDDFSIKAKSDYALISPQCKKNRNILALVMKQQNFIQAKNEWWHFDLRGWQNYKVINWNP